MKRKSVRLKPRAGARSADRSSPLDWQAPHHPVATSRLRLSGSREPTLVHRRVCDIRLWGAMSEPQQRAASRIATGFGGLTRGLGFRNAGRMRVDGGAGGAPYDHHAQAIDEFWRWAMACPIERISAADCLHVIAFGYSCRDVDGARRQRRGKARANLFAGLDLFCEQRRWTSSDDRPRQPA